MIKMTFYRLLENSSFKTRCWSEVSQKEKNKYRMLTHIYGIKKKKVLKNLGDKTGIKMQT